MSDTVALPPGHHGPDRAQRSGGGECAYCGDTADYKVWVDGVSFLTCQSCSVKNAINAKDFIESH